MLRWHVSARVHDSGVLSPKNDWYDAEQRVATGSAPVGSGPSSTASSNEHSISAVSVAERLARFGADWASLAVTVNSFPQES